MTEHTRISNQTRLLLSAMMFLQFMMLAVWFVPLAAYLDNIGVTGTLRALILSSMALGCLVSPIVGMVADRLFAGEKVLAVLNLLTGMLLLMAARADDPLMIFALLLAQMLCYMPTWGLTSAIAMAHAPAEKFPQIRVVVLLGLRLAIVVIGYLFAQRDQLGKRHRANRPIQFDIDSITIAAAQIPFVDGLFQASEFNFHAPTHFVVLDDHLVWQLSAVEDACQHPHLRLANLDVDQA